MHVNRVTYTSGLNLSLHEDPRQGPASLRLHGNHSVFTLRYGSSLAREARRAVRHARDHALDKAWEVGAVTAMGGPLFSYRSIEGFRVRVF